jgi:ATP-dependent DNA helicase RecG
VAAGQPEPEFEEQAGAVVVRFRPSGYHPPLRVSQDLSERQRQILLILSQGGDWTFGNIYERLHDPAAKRTIQADLRFLRDLNLVDLSGHGGAARWRLKMESQ